MKNNVITKNQYYLPIHNSAGEVIHTVTKKGAQKLKQRTTVVEIDGKLIDTRENPPQGIIRHNQCSCCVTDNSLTNHHIIPLKFGKFIDLTLRRFILILLCRKCHDTYEKMAEKLVYDFRDSHFELFKKNFEESFVKAKLYKLANQYLNKTIYVPESELPFMYEYMCRRTEKILTLDEIIELSQTKYEFSPDLEVHRLFFESFENEEAVVNFWINHFFENMNPIYMEQLHKEYYENYKIPSNQTTAI